MADDLMTALRALANRWAMRARDYARASKEEGATEAQVNYNRGYADGYYKAATELAALLTQPGAAAEPQPKPVSSAPAAGAAPQQPAPQRPAAPPPAPAQPPPPPKPEVKYAPVSVGEAVSILVFAGCQPRDVTHNKDNSLHATFSSWGSMMLHEQVDRVRNADPRIIILGSGKLESHDYYIDFAFKESSPS